jgi:hypothetical protein
VAGRRYLLTIDQSALSGFAHGDPLSPGVVPQSGVLKLPKGSLSARCNALHGFALKMIRDLRVTDLYVEQPFIQKTLSENAVYPLVGYMLVLGMAAETCGCYCAAVSQQTWRSRIGVPTTAPKNVMSDPYYASKFGHLKGGGVKEAKRQYGKDRVIDYARKMGSDPEDDNESDAIGIWHAMALTIRNKENPETRDFFDDMHI